MARGGPVPRSQGRGRHSSSSVHTYLLTDGHQVGPVPEHRRVVRGAAVGTHQARPDTSGADPRAGGPRGSVHRMHTYTRPRTPEETVGLKEAVGGEAAGLEAAPPGRGWQSQGRVVRAAAEPRESREAWPGEAAGRGCAQVGQSQTRPRTGSGTSPRPSCSSTMANPSS